MAHQDTIAAIATAPGRAGIGVIRISGKSLLPFARQITGRELIPRVATKSTFQAAGGDAIDDGIALYFPAPHSYTGEDVLEMQGHGGPAVQRALLARCLALGARVAEPGEFTKRAFLNGKLDLAQAESVADLIDATTHEAAQCALRSLQGEFSARIRTLADELITLRALTEATLDFPEEEIDVLTRADMKARLENVRLTLDAVLRASERGSQLREGAYIVLAGQPNVGKSSLLNRLAGEDVAIVTDIPGTTRDAIRQTINLGGMPVHIVDTAGLRVSSHPIEQMGMDRTWSAIEKADLVLLLLDACQGETEADREILAKLPPKLKRIQVINKIDLVPTSADEEVSTGNATVRLSAKTGAGVELLQATLCEALGWRSEEAGGLFLARARHLQALNIAKDRLALAATQMERPELFAEELRIAHEALGSITGEVTADDLLGKIFAEFCIGK